MLQVQLLQCAATIIRDSFSLLRDSGGAFLFKRAQLLNSQVYKSGTRYVLPSIAGILHVTSHMIPSSENVVGAVGRSHRYYFALIDGYSIIMHDNM